MKMPSFIIEREIRTIDSKICRHIDNISVAPRGIVAQDVLSDLRHFVEHIMLFIYANGRDLDDNYETLCKGIKYVESQGRLKFITNFHNMLQISVSHYVPEEDNSERLMLKYYESLFDIREYMRKQYGLMLLSNLERFPLNLDPKLAEYYEKIAGEIEKNITEQRCPKGEKYYIRKIKPFFVNGRKYYEVTFSDANDWASKTDRIIAFTKLSIMQNYSVRMSFRKSAINIINKDMPVNIIVGWEVAIRDCEFKNLMKITRGKAADAGYSETQALCLYMTRQNVNLLDIVCLSQRDFKFLRAELTINAKKIEFWNDLELCRGIIINEKPGQNILRYLLFTMNNVVLKEQWYVDICSRLSGLYLRNGCIPFDSLPFVFSPKEHNPRFGTLLQCIYIEKHRSELLARHIKNNSEVNGTLFTPLSELERYGDVEGIADEYNNSIYSGHRPACDIEIKLGHAYIHGYVEDCKRILSHISAFADAGIQNYSNSVDAWLKENPMVDSDEKKEILRRMFSDSKVSIIYGAAGTGKSTLIKYISCFFSDKTKLFLAQTNPAIDNLKRKIDVANSEFYTIAKFLYRERVRREYDILIIDECSTVSNRDMRRVIEKAKCKLLILVGDTYQIASIRFGNWFSIVKEFVPETASHELITPYRSSDNNLLTLWGRVRTMTPGVTELISKPVFSNNLDDSLFEKKEEDEIVLCLNYDGLYGINNLNRFLQENNKNKPISWGLQVYKEGDPILFNESERFAPVIYNNMKGVIRAVCILDEGTGDERIMFDIELDKSINGMDAWGQDFEIVEEYQAKNSVIRFCVNRRRSEGDEDDLTSNSVIPFQIAYAVSIHKAQGLEYDSVKLVITNEVEERITHNIFYTAITRARKKLKIYWSPEVQQSILSSIMPRNCNKDIALLKQL